MHNFLGQPGSGRALAAVAKPQPNLSKDAFSASRALYFFRKMPVANFSARSSFLCLVGQKQYTDVFNEV